MSFRIIGHTADLRLAIKADSLDGLFSDALAGMMAVIKKKPAASIKGKTIKRKIKIEAPDSTVLLIDFLSDVLSLSQVNKEIYNKVVFKKITATALEADLEGMVIDKFDEDIKAVTYHEADVWQNEDGQWQTNIVFDI